MTYKVRYAYKKHFINLILIKEKEYRPAKQLLGGIPNTVASHGFNKEGEPEVKDSTKDVGVVLIFSGSIGKRNKLNHGV
jgi:hypothetical protein